MEVQTSNMTQSNMKHRSHLVYGVYSITVLKTREIDTLLSEDLASCSGQRGTQTTEIRP